MENIEAMAFRARVATPSDSVLHSECAFTFYSPFSNDQGIVVNLNSFMGTIPDLAFSNASEDRDIFLRIVKKRVKRLTVGSEPVAPTKRGIGGEGRFLTNDDNDGTLSTYSILVMEKPSVIVCEIIYDDSTKETFPETIVKSVESIIHHVGLAVQLDLAAWQDDEEVPVTKYCQVLPFHENGVTMSPDTKSWKCQKRCDNENLFPNLNGGDICSRRPNWDESCRSKGAIDHFQETGERYPLIVKQGAITPEGSTVHADCYSYAKDEDSITTEESTVHADCYSDVKDEDGPVKISNLGEVVSKRGIQVSSLQKNEKSTAEVEIESNATYAFNAITEGGSKLIPVSGPGMQGLENLGNSCYLNSVVQLLGSLAEVASRYGTTPHGDVTKHRFFSGVSPRSAPFELLVQTAKLINALTSGAYAIPEDELRSDALLNPNNRLAPRMFKHLIGRGHLDFRTAQQQDAAQFLQYLLEQLERAELKYDRTMLKTSDIFSFQTQDRLVCSADQKVKYKTHEAETIWSLRVPMEKAEVISLPDNVESEQTKLKQADEKIIPTVSFAACLAAWSANTTVEDYRWPHLQNAVHVTTQSTRFQNFPRYLWVKIQRYQLGPDWQPMKLEVNLDIPENIDLSEYRAKGPQDGEDLVAERENVMPSSSQPAISEMALGMLMDMGFSLNGGKRALTAVGGSDTEAAMNWIFEHDSDPDFNDPMPESNGSSAASGSSDELDDGVVMSLVESLGFCTIAHVRAALKETNGAADRAADWLFSHIDDLDGAIASCQEKNIAVDSSETISLEDGDGKYTMLGMISHTGKNTGSGHYVAHIKRGEKWVIYNDEKVALSEKPPFQHAYMYLFQRSDSVGSKHPGF